MGSSLSPLRRNHALINPPSHGYYINEIPAAHKLIFPHVEHTPVLKEIGIPGLYILRLEGESKRYVFKNDDKPLSDEEKKQTTDQVLLVKRAFLDHGKLVYRKQQSEPEVVIVTLIDFENYELETIIKIVQNRVDYAQKHNYGLYVRWAQEFIPLVEEQNVLTSYQYIKPLVMRAAMHAFPGARHVMFVDQDTLFMNLSKSVSKDVFSPNPFEKYVKRNSPITETSQIRTYDNVRMEDARILIAQNEYSDLELDFFIISSDLYGKAFLEYLSDPLIRNFYDLDFTGIMAHTLEWHPRFLGRTVLVDPKIMGGKYKSYTEPNVPNEESDTYQEGDWIVSFQGCHERKSCELDIAEMYAKVQK